MKTLNPISFCFQVLICISLNKRMHNTIDLLIANLAATDILQACTIPFIITTRISIDWILGSVTCKMVTYLQVMTASVSILTMTVISIERYLSVQSLHNRKINIRYTCVAVSSTWLIGSVVWAPIYMFQVVRKISMYGKTYKFCYLQISDGFYQILLVFSLILLVFFLPLVIILINYVRIWRLAKSSSAKTNSSTSKKKQWRLTNMFVAIVVIFILMWTPFSVIIALIIATDAITSTMYTFAVATVLVGTVLNPILYGYFNENYRVAFRDVITCRCGNWDRRGSRKPSGQ